jgi:hypothetical protein
LSGEGLKYINKPDSPWCIEFSEIVSVMSEAKFYCKKLNCNGQNCMEVKTAFAAKSGATDPRKVVKKSWPGPWAGTGNKPLFGTEKLHH